MIEFNKFNEFNEFNHFTYRPYSSHSNHPYSNYRPFLILWKKHGKDIWENWYANLFSDLSLPSDFKQMLSSSFEHFFKTLHSACDHLIRNNLLDFYNELTDKFLLPNQLTLNPQIISRGMILLEKAIFPFLKKADAETRAATINCIQEIALQLINIMYEFSNKRIITSPFQSVEETSMVASLLELLPVDRISFAELNDRFLVIYEEWIRKDEYLEKIDHAAYSLSLEEVEKKNDIHLLPIQDCFVLIVKGIQNFTPNDLQRLNNISSYLTRHFLKQKQIATLQERISELEALIDLDEVLLRYSGIEGLVKGIEFCQKKLNFKRSAFFGFSPCSKTIEGILGINIDQQKIQSIREHLNNLPPLKEAYVTKKPVYLINACDKIPDVYIKWFGLTSVLIVPIIHDQTVYGWLAMDQMGERFEVSKRTVELSGIFGMRIGTYLGRSEEATRFIKEVNLTEREKDILKLLAEGYDNKKIAKLLYLSEHTVRDYVSNLMIKFNAKNRAQVVAEGFRHRLLK